MNKLVVITYILRVIGLLAVLLSLFGHGILLNIFPGLEGTSINPIFYSGVAIYLVGAVIYFFQKNYRQNKRAKELAQKYVNEQNQSQE